MTPKDVTRTEGEPHDRLARIAAAMIQTLEWHPDYEPGDTALVLVSGGDPRRGGTGMFGYEDDVDAVVDLFEHFRAVMEANGKTVLLAPLGEG
jgi:hypothetical protein